MIGTNVRTPQNFLGHPQKNLRLRRVVTIHARVPSEHKQHVTTSYFFLASSGMRSSSSSNRSPPGRFTNPRTSPMLPSSLSFFLYS